MSDTTTNGIRVQVESFYVPERSSPQQNHFFFAYHIRISNTGDETAQLISREWTITDGEGEVQRIEGPGVIGEQPVLEPGGEFTYTSYCPLKTPLGMMEGKYFMNRDDGESFEAAISPFTLAIPHLVN